jgi:hypothetical protein
MDHNPQNDQESMPEWSKFPVPNTIPAGWDVSAFDPMQEVEEEQPPLRLEAKKDSWSR